GADTAPLEGLLKLAAERGATVTVEPAFLHSPNARGASTEGRHSPNACGASAEGLHSPNARGASTEGLHSPSARGTRAEDLHSPSPEGRGDRGEGVSSRLRELSRRHRNLRHSAFFLDRFD